jgi:hypothetical protein
MAVETRVDVAMRMQAGQSVVAAELTAQRAVVQREIDALTSEGRKLVATIRDMEGKGGSLVTARLGEIEGEIACLRPSWASSPTTQSSKPSSTSASSSCRPRSCCTKEHRVVRFRHFRNLQSQAKGVLGESI